MFQKVAKFVGSVFVTIIFFCFIIFEYSLAFMTSEIFKLSGFCLAVYFLIVVFLVVLALFYFFGFLIGNGLCDDDDFFGFDALVAFGLVAIIAVIAAKLSTIMAF